MKVLKLFSVQNSGANLPVILMFWLKMMLSYLAFISISCSLSQPILPVNSQSFQQDFITDIQPVADSSDLKQLIKSLPVWDCPPPDCPAEMIDAWIQRNGVLQDDSLFVAGDGAQDQLRITRLSDDGMYEVEVGSVDWPEGGYNRYKLKRVSAGWRVVAR